MNFHRWFKPARLAAPEIKSSPLIALQLTGEARWTPRDYAALAREGVTMNAVGYACVRKIAEAASSVPLLLYDGAAEIAAHPLLDLLTRPNPQQSGAALFAAWYA